MTSARALVSLYDQDVFELHAQLHELFPGHRVETERSCSPHGHLRAMAIADVATAQVPTADRAGAVAAPAPL